MSCFVMYDGISFNSVLLGCEEESDKGGVSAGDWVRVDGIVKGAPDAELNVLDSERGGYFICASLEVLSWMKEEETCDPGQVCNIMLTGGY